MTTTKLHGVRVRDPDSHDPHGCDYEKDLSMVALEARPGEDKLKMRTTLHDADIVEGWLFAIDHGLCGWRKAITDAPNARVADALRWIKKWRRTA